MVLRGKVQSLIVCKSERGSLCLCVSAGSVSVSSYEQSAVCLSLLPSLAAPNLTRPRCSDIPGPAQMAAICPRSTSSGPGTRESRPGRGMCTLFTHVPLWCLLCVWGDNIWYYLQETTTARHSETHKRVQYCLKCFVTPTKIEDFVLSHLGKISRATWLQQDE